MKSICTLSGKLHGLACVSLLVALVCIAAGQDASQAQCEETKTTRILWLGSSSTYFHDMPRDVADWMTRFAGMPARSDLVGRSGTAVYKYLDSGVSIQYGLQKDQTVLDKIRDGKYDFVILQIPTDYLAGRGDNDRGSFVAGIGTYVDTIRSAGGCPLFYEQGWGEDDLFDAGDKLLFDLAVKHEVSVVPCRTAWRRIREERPDLELHNLPDRTHPGTLGKYVNLCCFYAALTGQSPVGLPVREVSYWPPLTDKQKRQARERLSQMTITDPYMMQLAGWMRIRSIASEAVALDGDVVGYFQKMAWQAWRGYSSQLRTPTSVQNQRMNESRATKSSTGTSVMFGSSRSAQWAHALESVGPVGLR